MALTTGLVLELIVAPLLNGQAQACALIGSSPANSELLTLVVDGTDPAHVRDFKNDIVSGLITALVNQRSVTVVHGDSSSIIDAVHFL